MAGARPKTIIKQPHKSKDNCVLDICRFYSSPRGCNKGDRCNFLHICRNYILQQCPTKRMDVECSFSHGLQSGQSRALFKRRFGIDPPSGEMLDEFREVFGATLRRPSFRDPKPTEEEIRLGQEKLRDFLQTLMDTSSNRSRLVIRREDPKKTEICQFYLHGICKFSGQVHKHPNYRHYSKPFQWQIRDSTESVWLQFKNECNCRIEKHYCDVTNSKFTGDITASSGKDSTIFKEVTIKFGTDPFTVSDKSGQTLHVRRLSTASHAQPLRYRYLWQKKYRTYWTWYWQDGGTNWTEYPKEEPEDDISSVTSNTAIEREYLYYKDNKGSSKLQVTTDKGTWCLDFSRMEQTTKIGANKAQVARRPKWNPSWASNESSDEPGGQVKTETTPRNDKSSSSTEVTSPSLSASNDESPTSGSPDQIGESLFICPYFLRGGCKKNADDGKYSHKRHFSTPYQWQFLDTTSRGADWEDFPQDENDDAEKSYCDVDTRLHVSTSSTYNRKLLFVHFDTNLMTGRTSDIHIRRLSTPSSVLKSNWKKAFCMEWIWYWQDERGKWIVYSEKNATGTQADSGSATIEQKYLEFKHEHGESTMKFTAGSQNYKLDFDAMEQTNVFYETCRRVRRRPRFVSMEERRRTSREISQSQKIGVAGVAVPTTWDDVDTQAHEVTLKRVSDKERTTISSLFQDTIGRGATILSIRRIQNLELWEDFSKMSDRMKRKNGGKPVLQKQLFHGTLTKDDADAICRQNFDWRLSGSSAGTVHGKGSYFTPDAGFAHMYTKADNHGNRYIFVAQVLVGTPTTGKSEYTRPPPKDPSNPRGDMYDSCVNRVHDPYIFVIFEKDQMYPEYLITYKKDD